MSKITKIFSFISIMFIAILLLVSCGGESDNKTGESTKTVDNSVFTDNYDIKITYTIKPTAETYTYKYVHDCRIQIKAKATAKDTCKIKLSIYDGEADAFSEEIITRYYSLNTKSSIDEKIEDVYTNELLLAWSNKMSIVDSTDTNYTKNFLNEKTISFESNGGSRCESISVNIVNSNLPTPTKTGYSFDGWYNNQNFHKKISNFNDINDGMKLYAKWSLINYTINYNITTDVTNENINKYNVETETFTLNEPTRTGYTFKGWYDKKDFSGNAITKISKGSWGSFTLYPKWEANIYDVELVFNDGSTENTIVKQTFGSNYSNLPTPIRDGFIFEGWFLNEKDYDGCVYSMFESNASGIVSIPNNHKLYAKWTEGTSGLTYAKNSNGWQVTGCSTKDMNEIIVPKSIIGIDVVSIKNSAFAGMTSLTKIDIPNTVTSIGSYAFSNCSNLTEINIPSGLTTINNHTFYGLSKITSINIPDGVESIGECAFYNCSGISELTIPSNCKSIGSYAFDGMNKIKSLVIPDSVTTIGKNAFYGFESLETLVIPFIPKTDTYTNYLGYVFGGSGTNYQNQDDSSFDASYVPKALTKITVTKVTEIGPKTFRRLSNILELTLPNTLTSIGSNAFYNCTGLTKVYFNGSLEEWNELISNSNDNTPLAYGAKLYILVNGEYVEANNV